MEHLQLNLRVERWWKYKSTRVYHRQHSRFASESASVTYAGIVPKIYLMVKPLIISLKALMVLMRIVVSSEVQPDIIWLISTSSGVFSFEQLTAVKTQSTSKSIKIFLNILLL